MVAAAGGARRYGSAHDGCCCWDFLLCFDCMVLEVRATTLSPSYSLPGRSRPRSRTRGKNKCMLVVTKKKPGNRRRRRNNFDRILFVANATSLGSFCATSSFNSEPTFSSACSHRGKNGSCVPAWWCPPAKRHPNGTQHFHRYPDRPRSFVLAGRQQQHNTAPRHNRPARFLCTQ